MAEQRTPSAPALPSRREIESTLEMLMDLLDQMDGDTDIEDENEHGDGSSPGIGVDDEPSLGSSNVVNQERAWKVCGADLEYDGDTVPDADAEPSIGSVVSHESRSQELWAQGPTDDREHDDEREPDVDDEPELGSTGGIDQEACWKLDWRAGCRSDELSFGATQEIDQTRWGDECTDPELCEIEDDELEFDHAESGIGDTDGMIEQGFNWAGEHCE